MRRLPHRTLPVAAVLAAAAALGVGGGAATYAALGTHTTTKTVVRKVPVAASEPAARTSALSVNQIYRQSYKGVVEITVASTSSDNGFPGAGPQSQRAQGSGFVYDSKGDIVTNQHVVDGATSVKVRFWDGSTYSAKVVGTDPSTDLAVIRVDAPTSKLSPLALGDSSRLQVGNGVVAIGSPFGLEETVTSGIVSALHRQISSPNGFAINDAVQTDAAINHGNSGGPLFDTSGTVVGVTAQIESDSGGNDGVGFAIPSNTVRSVVSQLIASGKAEHAYLGVSLEGTRVASVRSGSPAAKAGIHTGDTIISVDGKRVPSEGDVLSAVSAHKPGDSVSVTVDRNGRSRTFDVTLGNRPS